MENYGCNLEKLDKYFGWKDSERNIREILLKRDLENNEVLHISIKSKYRILDILDTYINGLPRDVNNIIYSFLSTVRELNYTILLPENYPFKPPIWVLKNYIENGKSIIYKGVDPNELYCGGDYSPSMHIDREILIYVSRLKWFNQE